MRYVTMDKVQPGDILANEIFDTSGHIIIRKNSILTAQYISRLIQYGFAGIYINDTLSEDIELDPAIDAVLKKDAMDSVRDLNTDKSIELSGSILMEIVRKKVVSLDMTDIHSLDDYTYAHSVGVTILSCVLGIGMKLSSAELHDLASAAILHDYGKLQIPKEVLNKQGRLTGEEYELIKSHVQRSYDLIKDRPDLSREAKMAVLMHHENEDGGGYPNGITGPNIPLLAKILHVADVYDALTSDRPYKKGYEHWEAAEYLMGGCGIMFDRAVVECFINLIPLYPKGAEVVLSNGDQCIVIENSGNHNMRPIVRRISDKKKIDLFERENLSLTIVSSNAANVADNEAQRNQMLSSADKKKIMIVDDMKTNLMMLKEILEKDYSLVLLKSGAQALTYLEKSKAPDLIIMDIDMPEMNGIETATKINEAYSYKIPILFVSSLSDINTVLACRTQKAAGYIVRPYQPIYVISEIKRIIEGHETF